MVDLLHSQPTAYVTYTADADGPKIVVPRVDSMRTAQAIIAGLLPLGHQVGIHKLL